MEMRLNYAKVQPASFKAMMALEMASSSGSIEKSLVELIKMRVSQINGCAFCMDMHAHDAVEAGENPQRLFVLPGWHDSPVFTPRERAALAWAEALTTLAAGHPSDDVYDALDPHFSDVEKVDLTLTITTINAWNRFGVGFRMVHPVRN
jgi:AhpD family alkylhydroperoxidase